jgi:hypothetical protein
MSGYPVIRHTPTDVFITAIHRLVASRHLPSRIPTTPPFGWLIHPNGPMCVKGNPVTLCRSSTLLTPSFFRAGFCRALMSVESRHSHNSRIVQLGFK